MSAPLPPEKLAAILVDYHAGMPMRELVAKHGCDKGTPARAARRMGGQIRGKAHSAHGPWTAERNDELRALWESGLTGSQIGVRLGTTKNSVIGRAHRLGLSPRGSRMPNGMRKAKESGVADPVIELPALPRMPKRLLLWDLDARHCKFPVAGSGEFTEFCGDERVVGWPYCTAHIAICYRKAAA